MNKTEKFWDKKAEGYANSQISDQETYERKLTETRSFLGPDMRVLEFGCGTGTTAIRLAPHVQHIDATDISENMLKIGRERAKDAIVDNISFSRGTLAEFNAGTASMDAVLALNVLHLLADRKTVLKEVARILKPGGVFISSTGCLGNSYLRFIKLVAPLGKVLGLLPDVYILKEAELVTEVKETGFTIESQWHHGMQDISVYIVARKK